MGRLYTCYAPVRRSPPSIATRAAPRLACIRPAASVHPEPGSNSPLYKLFFFAVYIRKVNVCYRAGLIQIISGLTCLYLAIHFFQRTVMLV